jgi:hypothetical protein
MLRSANQEIEVTEDQRPLREDRERVAVIGQRFEDPAHQAVATLGALVRIRIGAHRDVLALPTLRGELASQDLGRIDLHDDLGLEVSPGIHVEVGVRRTRETVVAHDAVRDEVTCAGRDIEHRHLEAKVIDRHDTEWRVSLQGQTFDRALPCDRRVDGVEERETLAKTTEEANVHASIRPMKVLDNVSELQFVQGCFRSPNDLGIGIRDPDDVPRTGAFCVEHAGEEALLPRDGRR